MYIDVKQDAKKKVISRISPFVFFQSVSIKKIKKRVEGMKNRQPVKKVRYLLQTVSTFKFRGLSYVKDDNNDDDDFK